MGSADTMDTLHGYRPQGFFIRESEGNWSTFRVQNLEFVSSSLTSPTKLSACVAQLVERLISTQQVAGSRPVARTKN